MWMTSCTGSARGGFWGFWKKSLRSCLGRRRLTFACSPRCHKWFGEDGKVSIERRYLSTYVEKPFNSKVIKSFVPELRSRKCFCVSGFLCYIYEHYERYEYVSACICVCIVVMAMQQILWKQRCLSVVCDENPWVLAIHQFGWFYRSISRILYLPLQE